MLYICLKSSYAAISGELQPIVSGGSHHAKAKQTSETLVIQSRLWRLAMPQLLLTVLAITIFHVQVITRIASGYPLVYMWTAMDIQGQNPQSQFWSSRSIVLYFIIYGVTQGGLFATFLPPA